jgi:hypothetical protein
MEANRRLSRPIPAYSGCGRPIPAAAARFRLRPPDSGRGPPSARRWPAVGARVEEGDSGPLQLMRVAFRRYWTSQPRLWPVCGNALASPSAMSLALTVYPAEV